jgi:26S proteasome regulatory subunit N1
LRVQPTNCLTTTKSIIFACPTDGFFQSNRPNSSKEERQSERQACCQWREKGRARGVGRLPLHNETNNSKSEADQNLKNELETLVERLKVSQLAISEQRLTWGQENDASLYLSALENLKTLIRTSTSSVTAVPKPLKFLRPFYPDLKKLYETWLESPVKVIFPCPVLKLVLKLQGNVRRRSLRLGHDVL